MLPVKLFKINQPTQFYDSAANKQLMPIIQKTVNHDVQREKETHG